MRILLLAVLIGLPAFAQENDPRQDLDDARLEERGLLDQINEVDQELHAVREEMGEIQKRVAEIESSRVRHEDEVASASALVEDRREDVADRIAALYRLQKRGLARVVFGAENSTELRRRMHYLSALVDGDVAKLENFGQNLERRKLAMAALDQDTASLSALRAELQLREADLRDKRARRLALLDDIRSRKDLALRALSEQARAQKGLRTRLQPRAPAPEARSASRSADQSVSAGFRAQYGKLPWPTTGRIVRRFGRYKDPYTNKTANSQGIEVAAEFGTPFRAVASGTVKLAEFISGYGQTVAIEHGPYTTIYAHANGLMVRRGQQVRQGQQLGSVGNTGLTTGSGYLLTFEIRYNGTPQDPIPWLSSR